MRRRAVRPPVVAVSGASGAGKTRLLRRLVPALLERGLRVAVLKHTRHRHALDVRGKDTDLFRQAGAAAAAISGPSGVAYFGPPVAGIADLVRLLPPVDLALAEGFRDEPLPRIEVYRRAVSTRFQCAADKRVFAVVSDTPPPGELAWFRFGEVEPLAALICARLGIEAGKPLAQRKRASKSLGLR